VNNVISFANAAEGAVFGDFAGEAIRVLVFAIKFRAQYKQGLCGISSELCKVS
jgi:hypothetical protein